MSGPFRLEHGGTAIDRGRALRFRFDGRELTGLSGDTLASALLANGVRVTGRSFKYHRPRGIMAAGAEEPATLVDLLTPAGREPNLPPAMVDLVDGLQALSQNRFPSLRLDLMAVNGLLAPFLAAGFYYKTFMAPRRFWERVYEPLIRRAAGLGRLEPGAAPAPEENIHDHADVLVIGAGAGGLAAARTLAGTGLRVLLADQEREPGGGARLDPAWGPWIEAVLAGLDGVRLLPRTTIVAAWPSGLFLALERLQGTAPRERLRLIHARRVVLATGATERLIAFPGNDRPGVMLAGAALDHLRRFAVAMGRRPVLFTAHDEAYRTAEAYAEAGIAPAAIVDVREGSAAGSRLASRGVPVLFGHQVVVTRGRHGLTGVTVAPVGGGPRRRLEADALLVSGGWTFTTGLARQLGGAPGWNDDAHSPAVTCPAEIGVSIEAASLAEAAAKGAAAGAAVAAAFGRTPSPCPPSPEAVAASAPAAFFVVNAPGKAFVDLQHDVTVADIHLAHREGYAHVEHMKRYTTHGMATDQGRTGGLIGAAVLAQARGVPLAEVGLPTPRPFAVPVPFAALAGAETGARFRPKRRLPLQDWHEAAGARLAVTGLWLRPLVYATEGGWGPVLDEARAVRRGVGVTDMSSLGKIDVKGPDAARFLDLVYATPVATLAVGRCRYGVMLREDGMMLDDGTLARLGETHFRLTTTTANRDAVLDHLDFHAQAVWPTLDVVITDVSEHWAQFAVAGPRSRETLAPLVDIDLANEALPPMATRPAMIAGVSGRLFRLSFSGERAFEIAVPARHALPVWTAIIEAGARPYGLDALNTLRIEKGHVTAAEMNGNTSMDDLGLGRLMKPGGDFIGRTLAGRQGLRDPDRLQLVGARPLDPAARLRNGAHLIAADRPGESLGTVTSSTPSVALPFWVGLALVAGGHGRIGTELIAASPLHGESVPVAIVPPHFVDPENARVRG